MSNEISDLTSISTHGWFVGNNFQVDFLRAIGTYGWYGVTVGDLVEFFKTKDFTLIVNRLEAMGLEIHRIEEIDPIAVMYDLSTVLVINRTENFELMR